MFVEKSGEKEESFHLFEHLLIFYSRYFGRSEPRFSEKVGVFSDRQAVEALGSAAARYDNCLYVHLT
jgi:hypothetical protein